ncbi:MAG: hypothetical protein M3178_10615 [Pseudomonadota bacterium]|nr:hypothetical protein [Pseudomonadota bacterium]
MPGSGASAGKHHPTKAEKEKCLLLTDTDKGPPSKEDCIAWAIDDARALEKKFPNCEAADFRDNGEEYCMSKKQIAALNRETEAAMAKAAAKEKEDAKVNLKNCARESGDSKTVGSWDPRAKPTEEECRPYLAQIQAIEDARANHAVNQEIDAQCARMADVAAINWTAISALRGIRVTLNDCVKAATALSIEDDAQ